MSHAVSIHIGVNDPRAASAYDMRARLSDSETAAWRMAELASQAGYDSMLVLRGRTATLAAVNAALWNVSQLLEEDDALLVTFSGHGGQVQNNKGDELGSDESWTLYDGELLDDTLAGYWRLFKPGVRIVVVSESCYSGGMDRGDDEGGADHALHPHPRRRLRGRRSNLRGEPDWAIKAMADATRSCVSGPPRYANAIHATVLMLTASAEHQPAQGNLFTDTLLEVWDGGRFTGSYCELYRAVSERVKGVKSDQEPQIMMLGSPDTDFPLGPAFHRTRSDACPSRDVVYR